MVEIQDIKKAVGDRFYTFFVFFWPLISTDEFVYSKHIEFICNELNDLGHHIINRTKPPHDWYIFNVPPGTTKSSIISVMWPIWLITHDPSVFVINSSYSAGLSERDVRKSKSIITSPEYSTIFGEVKMAKNTESYFETVQGGGRYATSTGGTIVGFHGNVNMHDDPLSVEMSYSPADRARANRFVTETMTQRVRNKDITPQVIIMQRLNEQDPTGYIVERGLNVKHYVLPDVLDEKTTHPELYTNGLLDPVRLSYDVIERKRKELGEISYSAQYKQNPTSKESLLYDDFETYTDLPATIGSGNYTDTADAGDSYLCSISYEKTKDRVYVRDVLYTQESMDRTEDMVVMLFERNNTRNALIESNAGGRYFATKVKLKAIRTKVTWFHQGKNKESRILTNQSTVNQMIVMPYDWEQRWPIFARHVKGYKREFRANKYHDAPDVLTGIVEKEFFGSTGSLKRRN